MSRPSAQQIVKVIVERSAKICATLRAWRVVIGMIALACVVAGIFWSFSQLQVTLGELKLGPLLLLALVMAPISLAYGAIGMVLTARAAGASMKFATAWSVNNHAQLAEALPVPGGAIVRTGGLIQAGIKTGTSAALVLGGAILWIALAAIGAGIELAMFGNSAGLPLALGGTAVSAGVAGWLWRFAGPVNMALTLVHRLAGLAITTVRLQCAFAVIGIALPALSALPFALAMIAGSAASITPAGLGISEGLAALVADSVSVVPAAAFLAVVLNRLTGMAVNALCLLPDYLFHPRLSKIEA